MLDVIQTLQQFLKDQSVKVRKQKIGKRLKKIFVLMAGVSLLSTIVFANPVYAQTPFSRTNVPAQIKITAYALNVRSGPSANFLKVGVVYKDQVVDCLGKIGTWYVVHLENDTVGVVSGSYAKPYYPPVPAPAPAPAPAPTPAPTPAPSAEQPTLTAEEQKMLNLINAERSKVGVAPLAPDAKLMEVARLKAKDMVANNYFSHTSPTYGSPFDMMKQFGITYRTAAENIAGNSTVEAAHEALMNSEGHRANILNAAFNFIGIGIVDSPQYGKVFVQMFIGR